MSAYSCKMSAYSCKMSAYSCKMSAYNCKMSAYNCKMPAYSYKYLCAGKISIFRPKTAKTRIVAAVSMAQRQTF
jgi:hypothetical protein